MHDVLTPGAVSESDLFILIARNASWRLYLQTTISHSVPDSTLPIPSTPPRTLDGDMLVPPSSPRIAVGNPEPGECERDEVYFWDTVQFSVRRELGRSDYYVERLSLGSRPPLSGP